MQKQVVTQAEFDKMDPGTWGLKNPRTGKIHTYDPELSPAHYINRPGTNTDARTNTKTRTQSERERERERERESESEKDTRSKSE